MSSLYAPTELRIMKIAASFGFSMFFLTIASYACSYQLYWFKKKAIAAQQKKQAKEGIVENLILLRLWYFYLS